MNDDEIDKIECLTLDLNMDLCILNSAVNSDDSNLQVVDLTNFIERIYRQSCQIREIFTKAI